MVEAASTAQAQSSASHIREEMALSSTRPVFARIRCNLRYKVFFALALPFALLSLDSTIIATALPTIAFEFDQLQEFNWIISTFNLTSAAFLPAWAQLADVFGRHSTILAAMIILGIGSAVCVGAPVSQFAVLLFGRAIQGIGAAGVNIIGHTIMADRASLHDYAWNWTLSAVISAVFLGIGPLIGGYLTEVSWRWCFAINLPILVAAAIILILLLRKELVGPQQLPQLEETSNTRRTYNLRRRLSTIDFVGQILFLCGIVLIILSLTWAGGKHPWTSAHVLVPLILGAVLMTAWISYEYSMSPPHAMSKTFPAQQPMMSWELLSQKDIGLLFLVNFSMGMAMFAVIYFMELYFAKVVGYTPSKAGRSLLYYLPGIGGGAYIAQLSSNAWPRQTFPLLLTGAIMSAVGITVITQAIRKEMEKTLYIMMALTGCGIGMRLNPSALHALAVFSAMNAQITCLMLLSVPLGGTFALTLMSTVFNNKDGTQHENAKGGITYAFVAIIPFMWLTVLITTFLGNVWILKEGHHEIMHGAYFWMVLSRRKIKREIKLRGEATAS